MRVLICGSRYYNDINEIEKQFSEFKFDKSTTIITGGAKGVDDLAHKTALKLGLKTEVYKADWNKYGKRAGPIRNKEMLLKGKPDFVIAIHENYKNSLGTKNMVEIARKNNVFVIIIEPKINV